MGMMVVVIVWDDKKERRKKKTSVDMNLARTLRKLRIDNDKRRRQNRINFYESMMCLHLQLSLVFLFFVVVVAAVAVHFSSFAFRSSVHRINYSIFVLSYLTGWYGSGLAAIATAVVELHASNPHTAWLIFYFSFFSRSRRDFQQIKSNVNAHQTQ